MSKSKAHFYTVWQGRTTGVFDSWEECKAQVQGFAGAQYKGFATREQAEAALQQSYSECIATGKNASVSPSSATSQSDIPRFVTPSLAVDAACTGNPGDMEYRGVWVMEGKENAEWFRQGVYHEATNNIGEFLAIVHGLALLKRKGIDLPLYSDSATAQAWIRAGKCKTKLARTPRNEVVFQRIEAAERWLAQNTYSTRILKWRTDLWGEIPADFGRK